MLPRSVREECKASPGAKSLLEGCNCDVDRESNRVFLALALNGNKRIYALATQQRIILDHRPSPAAAAAISQHIELL